MNFKQTLSPLIVAMTLAFNGCVLAATQAQPVSIAIEPPEILLLHSDQNVQLLITVTMNDGSLHDATHQARITLISENKTAADSIASVEKGVVTAKADGLVTLKATLPNTAISATAKVTVQGFGVDRKLNFTNDIIPILTKSGCNAGGCHGKQGGQNGFSLSLLGFEPDNDYEAIVEEGKGRRIFPAAPDQSLLLQKATSQFVHGGGKKIEPNSKDYLLLRRWLVDGMPRGAATDPTVERIEFAPRERILSGVSSQQLRIVAYYSDKTAQDVTNQTEFKSQQPDILKVEHSGLVSTLDRTGEGAIMVRYMGLVDVAKFSVPFNKNIPAEAYAHFKPKSYVDNLVLEKWKKLGIAPSPVCRDDEFIRRAYLDTIGTLPSADEVRAFLADTTADKRDKLVDKVLERPEYADYWANMWGDLLRNKREGEEQKRGTYAFSAWIRDCFARNLPYDQFVREILTAQGEVGDNPAVNWYRHVRNQVHLVNDTSQLFLGTRLSCANCHHHPYEKISQEDYWGFAAFFQRIGKKQGDVPADSAVFVQKTGETTHPRSGKKLKPKGIGGTEYEYVRGADPRQNLVAWMTQPENPYFSKAISNRMWGQLMGIGIVNSVDDMRVTNPPSNPALLEALAKDLVEHKYDLKHLLRTIMKSQTYGLSSDPIPYNVTDRQNYARYRTKRLSAEALLDALSNVTGSPERFNGFPIGTRAIELPDQAVSSYFLNTFGRSERETPCECERSYAPNLAQTLHLMNSNELQQKLQDVKGTLATLLKEKKNDQIIEELYLRTFARRPKSDELSQALGMLDASTDRKAALEDFTWVLLNSKEFLFNH